MATLVTRALPHKTLMEKKYPLPLCLRVALVIPIVGLLCVVDYTHATHNTHTHTFKNKKVIVSSHLGRPKGEVVEDKRLTPIAPVLSEAIQAPVKVAPDSVGPEAQAFVQNAEAGDVILLENTRFHKGETKNDETYAKQLQEVSGAEIYVNDAFGAAHRAHASTHGITKFVKHKVSSI